MRAVLKSFTKSFQRSWVLVMKYFLSKVVDLQSKTFQLKKDWRTAPCVKLPRTAFLEASFEIFRATASFCVVCGNSKVLKHLLQTSWSFFFQTSRWCVVVLKSSFDEKRTIDDVPWGIFGKIFKSEQNSWKTPLLNIDFFEDFTYLLKSPILRNAFQWLLLYFKRDFYQPFEKQ